MSRNAIVEISDGMMMVACAGRGRQPDDELWQEIELRRAA
jgi:hypothetical protein